jgi:hypothetical protein
MADLEQIDAEQLPASDISVGHSLQLSVALFAILHERTP